MNANSMNPEGSGTPGNAGTPDSSASAGTPDSSANEEPSPRSHPLPDGGRTAPQPRATPQQNFFDWIRSQGIRRGPDRWIGGVSSGVAHRFGIDPLIVRGIFIVLALFAGIGVLLYGLAWALLPEPDGRIHVQEAAAGRWSGGMTGALITTIIGLPGLGRGFWGWGWNGLPGLLWTLFWMGAVIYFIYFLVQRNKGAKAAQSMNQQNFAAASYETPTAYEAPTSYGTSTAYGTPAATATNPATGTSPATGTNSGVPVYGQGQPGTKPQGHGSGSYEPSGPRPPYGPTPPQGGQPFSGQPHNGGPKPPRARRKGPGPAIVAVTAGVALLVGGTLKALDAGNIIELGHAANAVVWAAGAAVLGLGILIAGLRGRTAGFLGFLAVVALIIGGIFNVVPRNGDRFTFHDVDWAPVSIDQARQGVDVTGAKGTVNLNDLDLTPPLTTEIVVPVDATFSNVTVIIPDDVPVEVRADMTFGNLNEHGSDRGGRLQDERTVYNAGKPGANLVVEIDGTFSNVTVQEGN
jgi:phage shock protein PspC (stress-responsive transcriptional regulator)